MSSTTAAFEQFLSRFHLTEFRPGQENVITSVLDGHDCLCIMPTGGGKSLCFQLPSLARDGVTLVVSPLIALMKDQVNQLSELGIRATFINSSLSFGEQRSRINEMADGQYDLVYIAPERLRNSRFENALRETNVQLLAIDEAHCISEWGHDFRPDYAKLGTFRERMGKPQTIALTATATPLVREDIVRMLDMEQPRTFVTGFARQNLRFEVARPQRANDKERLLLDFLAEVDGPGIIYASTRRVCEELVTALAGQLRRNVGVYHAGLSNEERKQVQDSFMSGELPIIVATNAFGMGINKRDLRFVVHFTIPGSLEAYYQEAGRAGRDGEPSRCLLMFHHSDRFVQEFFIECNYPARETVRDVYEFLRHLRQDPIEITQQELKERLELKLGSEGVGACEKILEKAGAIERLAANQNAAAVRISSELTNLVDLLPKEATTQRKVLQAIEHLVGPRRNEHVFFQPATLQRTTDLPREAIARSLRELRKLACFDYVPPFRGRAIHLPTPDVPFAQLDIDFEELQRRKAAEFEKLERVIDYAHSRQCRQLLILKYFGDSETNPCGSCDTCQPLAQPLSQDSGSPAVEVEGGVLQAMRIVLSGVARSKARFGKTMVAQMLCGSQNSKITRTTLTKLSTYGLLDFLTQNDVLAIMDQMLAIGLLKQEERNRHRPLVSLTDRGREIMKGEGSIDFSVSLPAHIDLKLRRLATISSQSQATKGDQRAGRESPKPAAETVDDPRLDHDSASDLTATDLTATDQIGDNPALEAPPHYWTWRLLSNGFSLYECTQIRNLDEATIQQHVQDALLAGLQVLPEWLA